MPDTAPTTPAEMKKSACGKERNGWACVREDGHDGYHMGRKGLTVLSWNDHGHQFTSTYGQPSGGAR